MKKAALACAAAAVLFGICPWFSSSITGSGIPVSFMVMALNIASALINLALVRLRRLELPPLRLKPAAPMLLTGMLGTGMTTFFLGLSYERIGTATATVCHFLYPVFVVFAMWLIFKRRPAALVFAAMACAVAGVCLLMSFTPVHDHTGFLFAGLSVLTYGGYLLLNEVAPYAKLDANVRMVFFASGTALLFFFINLIQKNLLWPWEGRQWALLAGMALCSTSAHTLLAYGIGGVGAVNASFITLLEPLTSTLIGALFLHEAINFNMYIGIFLIIAAVLLVSVSQAREAGGRKRKRTEE